MHLRLLLLLIAGAFLVPARRNDRDRWNLSELYPRSPPGTPTRQGRCAQALAACENIWATALRASSA
jgi:hypothetical protein